MPARSTDQSWWETRPRPALLLGAGVLIGPQALALLNAHTIASLEPLFPIALAAVGILAPYVYNRKVVAIEIVPVIVAAIVLLASTPDTAVFATGVRAWRAFEACGAALLTGLAGALLLGRATSLTERRVYILALLLVLGGLADFAAVPALAMGATAALFWRRAVAMEPVRLDLDYVYRPLTAALLILAGARTEISETVALLAALCVVLTLFTRRLARGHGATSGVLAVSVAIDLVRGLDATLAPLTSAVVISVVAMQLTASVLDAGALPSVTAATESVD